MRSPKWSTDRTTGRMSSDPVKLVVFLYGRRQACHCPSRKGCFARNCGGRFKSQPDKIAAANIPVRSNLLTSLGPFGYAALPPRSPADQPPRSSWTCIQTLSGEQNILGHKREIKSTKSREARTPWSFHNSGRDDRSSRSIGELEEGAPPFPPRRRVGTWAEIASIPYH